MRTIRYHQIADHLRNRIAGGEFAAGRLLPSEAELGSAYEASRVTIRKALEVLRGEGVVDARQGIGWFAATDRLPQTLATLATIEGQLSSSGRTSERRVLDFQFVDAPPHVAPLLGKRVLETRRLSLADGSPFARVTVWCPDHLGASLSLADVERSSFYELLPIEVGGATQSIGAQIVDEVDASLLEIPAKSAVLVVKRTTHDRSGEVVLVSEHVFPGHLTEFVAELASAEDDVSPTGLRLLDQ